MRMFYAPIQPLNQHLKPIHDETKKRKQDSPKG